MTDALGETMEFEYDAVDRLLSSVGNTPIFSGVYK